jgi:hypothetical protein
MQTLRRISEEIRNDVQNYKKNMWDKKTSLFSEVFFYIYNKYSNLRNG